MRSSSPVSGCMWDQQKRKGSGPTGPVDVTVEVTVEDVVVQVVVETDVELEKVWVLDDVGGKVEGAKVVEVADAVMVGAK
mmetsp:Transcript_115915/g.289544  ORF Transcript_115915/g.289544 Transcript_115915/m.289544 type:complete len:80 (+) Transcript_115915:715-954(+)